MVHSRTALSNRDISNIIEFCLYFSKKTHKNGKTDEEVYGARYQGGYM